MRRPLNLIPGLIVIAGLVCLAIGAAAVATLEGATNGQTDLYFAGLVLASLGAGLVLHS